MSNFCTYSIDLSEYGFDEEPQVFRSKQEALDYIESFRKGKDFSLDYYVYNKLKKDLDLNKSIRDIATLIKSAALFKSSFKLANKNDKLTLKSKSKQTQFLDKHVSDNVKENLLSFLLNNISPKVSKLKVEELSDSEIQIKFEVDNREFSHIIPVDPSYKQEREDKEAGRLDFKLPEELQNLILDAPNATEGDITQLGGKPVEQAFDADDAYYDSFESAGDYEDLKNNYQVNQNQPTQKSDSIIVEGGISNIASSPKVVRLERRDDIKNQSIVKLQGSFETSSGSIYTVENGKVSRFKKALLDPNYIGEDKGSNVQKKPTDIILFYDENSLLGKALYNFNSANLTNPNPTFTWIVKHDKENKKFVRVDSNLELNGNPYDYYVITAPKDYLANNKISKEFTEAAMQLLVDKFNSEKIAINRLGFFSKLNSMDISFIPKIGFNPIEWNVDKNGTQVGGKAHTGNKVSNIDNLQQQNQLSQETKQEIDRVAGGNKEKEVQELYEQQGESFVNGTATQEDRDSYDLQVKRIEEKYKSQPVKFQVSNKPENQPFIDYLNEKGYQYEVVDDNKTNSILDPTTYNNCVQK